MYHRLWAYQVIITIFSKTAILYFRMEIAKEAMLDLNQGSQSTKSSALISLIVK
jgi:hypothetical protein